MKHDRDNLTYVINVSKGRHGLPTVATGNNSQLLFVMTPFKQSWDPHTGMIHLHIANEWEQDNPTAHARLAAWFDIHDPAKLAETIACEVKRLGVIVHGSGEINGYVMLSYDDGKHCTATMQMPAARAILAGLIRQPNLSKTEAERVLRGFLGENGL